MTIVINSSTWYSVIFVIFFNARRNRVLGNNSVVVHVRIVNDVDVIVLCFLPFTRVCAFQ